jgi:hypothetical protein
VDYVKQLKKILFSPLLLPAGLLLTGIGGAFLPWIWRDSVALQLTGPGLAEFVKFLPQVRAGQVSIERLYFLLPLFGAMLALPLAAENKTLTLPVWLRWGLRLAVIPLALASLSPVWTPATLVAAEFRLQTILAATAVGLAVIAPLLKNLSLKIIAAGWGLIGLAAIILPLWQFSLIQGGMIEAYHEPVALGWGWWVTVAAIGMSIASGIAACAPRRPSSRQI